MKIAGNRTISAPQAVVESVLRDGQRLAEAIPDFHLDAPLDAQRQRGTLTIRVGPMRGQYEGAFTIAESKSAVWEITFNGHSAQGIFQGNGRIQLTPQNEQTIIHYEGDIEVAGQLASLPPRLLQANVNAIIRRCLDGVERAVWPEKFAAEPELAASIPAWVKTAVVTTLTVVTSIFLIRIIGQQFNLKAESKR